MSSLAIVAFTAALLPAAAATVSAAPAPLGGDELARPGVVVADPAPGAAAPPEVDATAYLLADAGSGDVLAGLDAHVPRPPASVVKLLTALALLPDLDPQQTHVATEADASVEGSRVGLSPGQTYTVEQLTYGLMLASGNDAAHALAEVAGGQQQAVDAMNAEADRLGAWRTRALTPHGLDEPGQVSTPYDLALLARTALADERVAGPARTATYDFPGGDDGPYQIQNLNRLLGHYPGTVGLKTGFTSQAGHTLAAAAERDGHLLIAVVLGAEGRAEDTAAALLDWAFASGEAARPVGTLLTPEEVAEERHARERASGAGGTAAQLSAAGSVDEAVDDVLGAARTLSPRWWVVLGSVVVLTALLWLRRNRGRGVTGRYAPGDARLGGPVRPSCRTRR
jgi:serine-type D-Ala-D-Ala carboxypeptidase (penicillin-binding protein 5/6)